MDENFILLLLWKGVKVFGENFNYIIGFDVKRFLPDLGQIPDAGVCFCLGAFGAHVDYPEGVDVV